MDIGDNSITTTDLDVMPQRIEAFSHCGEFERARPWAWAESPYRGHRQRTTLVLDKIKWLSQGRERFEDPGHIIELARS